MAEAKTSTAKSIEPFVSQGIVDPLVPVESQFPKLDKVQSFRLKELSIKGQLSPDEQKEYRKLQRMAVGMEPQTSPSAIKSK